MVDAMFSLAVRPRSPALLPFVKSLHYHENDWAVSLERILPNGQAHLMINLAEDQFRSYRGSVCQGLSTACGAVLAGPHGQSTVIDTAEQRWLAAVQFRAGGAAVFFRLPLSEARDQMVGLDLLWGIDGAVVRERLHAAPTPVDKLRVLETILLERLSPRWDPAVVFAMAALERGMPVRETAAQVGLLPRTLARRFEQQVGLTPKRFARVRRLQRILKSARRGAEWPIIAAEQGYADQAHLVHDFKDLTGITPTAYRPQSPRRGNHILVSTPGS